MHFSYLEVFLFCSIQSSQVTTTLDCQICEACFIITVTHWLTTVVQIRIYLLDKISINFKREGGIWKWQRQCRGGIKHFSSSLYLPFWGWVGGRVVSIQAGVLFFAVILHQTVFWLSMWVVIFPVNNAEEMETMLRTWRVISFHFNPEVLNVETGSFPLNIHLWKSPCKRNFFTQRTSSRCLRA